MEVDDDNCVNDSASDSSDDEAMQAEQQAKADELERKVQENVYSYDDHVSLISVLRELVEFDKLRNARERMAKYYPLSSNLWMDWLKDEIKIATAPEEKEKIVQLFERAIQDYLSIEVWLEYVQFSIGLQSGNTHSDIEKVRSVFERALAAGGLHVAKGALLWEAYTEFEVVVLSLNQDKGDAETDKQLKRIANLFRRQLSCPLLDMAETYERFNMWLVDNTGSLDSKIIDRSLVETTYKKSLEKLSKIEKFEESLSANADYSTYKEYLEHEKSSDGSPARVQCLYERALADLCLNDALWLEYVEYLDGVLKDGKCAQSVVARAIRNCPWSLLLYQAQLNILEKYEAKHESITETVEQALTSGLVAPTDFRNIWMSFLEYMRRRVDSPDISKEEEDKRLKELRAAFSKAVDYLNGVEGSDPECLVAQFWARIESKMGKNLEQSRLLWADILAEPSRRTAVMWLEYISLEATYGDSKHLRKLYPRAIQQVTDWPESIYSSWLNFERDEGTLESYLNCVNKSKARIEQFKEVREKEANLNQQNTFERIQQKREEGRRLKRAGLGFNSEKRMAEPENKNRRKRPFEEPAPVEGSPEKKKRFESNKTEDIVNQVLKEEGKDHGVSVPHDSSKDDRTVFISNLDYSTSDQILREIFSADGNIADLRLVKDFKGRSKGYCYIEFDKTDSAFKALKRDRQLIGERPMFVSRCDPDKETRGSAFKFSARIEKNKLFVKGLPFSIKPEAVRELFEKFGALKDVRLVTYRNGHSKGLAYVDFEDDTSAAQAVLKTDGSVIDGKTISVSISNPPKRQNIDPPPLIASLGGGPKATGPRGRGRTQISFIPRTLQLAAAAADTKGIANLTIASPQPKENVNL